VVGLVGGVGCVGGWGEWLGLKQAARDYSLAVALLVSRCICSLSCLRVFVAYRCAIMCAALGLCCDGRLC